MTGARSEPRPALAQSDAATLRALTAARADTRDLAEQLLTHLPEVGDRAAQRALDAWVEQAADTLRALSEAMEERLFELGTQAATPSTVVSPAVRLDQ